MFDTSLIEISESALRYNLAFIKKKMNPGVRLCSVVKGNAYGHGVECFVPLALEQGVDYFAVHSAGEAVHVLKSTKGKADLFIMGHLDKDSVEWAVRNSVEFAVFDMKRLKHALKAASLLGKNAKVHIEIETGMFRTGFESSQWEELLKFLKDHSRQVEFTGIFTHLAGAESQANHFRISKQLEVFSQGLEYFEKNSLKPKYHHISCSAGLLNYPHAPGNMVRIGILQYGFWPNKETHIRFCGKSKSNPQFLKRLIRWSTNVMAVKEVSKGNYIGYGTTYLAHENMRLAVLPVGYSHGYNRNLSNVGSVLINGNIAPVVGTINMNSLTVDATACGEVKPGDEVVLIGTQRGKQISVNSFSEQSHQLNYELLTRLPVQIPRKVVK
jgi:alanine racemase